MVGTSNQKSIRHPPRGDSRGLLEKRRIVTVFARFDGSVSVGCILRSISCFLPSGISTSRSASSTMHLAPPSDRGCWSRTLAPVANGSSSTRLMIAGYNASSSNEGVSRLLCCVRCFRRSSTLFITGPRQFSVGGESFAWAQAAVEQRRSIVMFALTIRTAFEKSGAFPAESRTWGSPAA